MASVEYILSTDLNDGNNLKLHGAGVANCGNYPAIYIDFKIIFTRDTGSSTVHWDIQNLQLYRPDTGRYDYEFYAAIAVNPIDPQHPVDSSSSDPNNELWYILEKGETSGYGWQSHVTQRSPDGDITVTSDKLSFYIYVKERCTCVNEINNRYCYDDSDHNDFYIIKAFENVSIPTYETSYTVTYNTNGGVGNIPPQIKSSLSDLTLSTTTPVYPLTLKYYNNGIGTASNTETLYRAFLGWRCSADNQLYPSGGTYTLNADCTMTAEWGSATFTSLPIPNKYYTVTYNYNGGTGSPASTSCARGEIGYATSSGSTTKVYDQNTTYSTGITTDLNLYPIYGNATLNTVPTPTREGCNFLGWYTDSTFEHAVTLPLTVASDMTIYAKWLSLPLHIMKPDGTWGDIGPYVWRFNGTSWEKVAHIYKFDGTAWRDIST